MKLKFDFQIQSLDGKAFEGEENNASSILANALSRSNKGNAIKLWDWAMKIYKKEVLDIPVTDVEVLKALIEENQTLPVITKAQLLKHIEEVDSK